MKPAGPAGWPEIVAHRGDAEHFPENSLPAIEAALHLGLHYVEFDVQLSADAEPFVIHDVRLERTTHASGDLREMSAAELDQVEAGEPRRFGQRHAGVRLPRLAEVAGLLRRFPEACAFVEVKRASIAHHGHSTCIRNILDALEDVATQCILISFDAEACRLARTVSGLPVGWVFEGDPANYLEALTALNPEFVFCDQQQLPAGLPLPPGPWRWAVYEVKQASLARSLHRRGAALVESMVPAQLLAELAQETGASP